MNSDTQSQSYTYYEATFNTYWISNIRTLFFNFWTDYTSSLIQLTQTKPNVSSPIFQQVLHKCFVHTFLPRLTFVRRERSVRPEPA